MSQRFKNGQPVNSEPTTVTPPAVVPAVTTTEAGSIPGDADVVTAPSEVTETDQTKDVA